MRRQLIVIAALAALVVACDAVTTPSAGSPAASSATDAPASAEVSPRAEPTTEELAALYSKAEATADKADDKADEIWRESSKSLEAATARSRRHARATLTFLRTVREIPWSSDLEPIARRLVKCKNTVYVYEKNAGNGKSYKALNGRAAVDKYERLAGRMGAKCSVVAHKLRLELGLDRPFEPGVWLHSLLLVSTATSLPTTAGWSSPSRRGTAPARRSPGPTAGRSVR